MIESTPAREHCLDRVVGAVCRLKTAHGERRRNLWQQGTTLIFSRALIFEVLYRSQQNLLATLVSTL